MYFNPYWLFGNLGFEKEILSGMHRAYFKLTFNVFNHMHYVVKYTSYLHVMMLNF